MDAKAIVQDVLEGRMRFGEMYGLGTFSPSQILNALVELHEEGLLLADANSEELTKVKRQLTASKAREAKLKKQIEKLKEEKGDLNVALLQAKATKKSENAE
jgi:septal ring factor EnvC (AmiA/AmiB activator)